jgi:GAF domain-containing protein
MDLTRDILHGFAGGSARVGHVHEAVCMDILEHVKSTRAGIWYFNETGDELTSACVMDARTHDHTSGAVCKQSDFPEYFAAIRANPFIFATHARNQPETRCLDKLYFRKHGIVSLLDHQISLNGQPTAVLCCEHCGDVRHWSSEEQNYLSAMAVLLKFSFQMQMLSARRELKAA